MTDEQPRCIGCNAEVHDTVHTISEFRVGGFRLFTGDRVPAKIQGQGSGTPKKEYDRLINTREIWICPRCVADESLLGRVYAVRAVDPVELDGS